MSKPCPKRGMQSDRDDLCTWCNADLRPTRKTAPTGPAPAGRSPATVSRSGTQPPASRDAAPTPARNERPPWLLPALIGAVLIAALVGALVWVGIAAQAAPPDPGEWESFTSRDNSFTAWYPTGWGQPGNAGAAGSFVLVEWKAARLCTVVVEGTQKAGAIGDAAAVKERTAGRELLAPETADGAILDFYMRSGRFAAERRGMEQSAPEFTQTFANIRSVGAEYSYTRRVGLLPVKMQGFRFASFQGDYGYHAFAEAPAQHWNTFRPVAEQILSSVRFGARGQ